MSLHLYLAFVAACIALALLPGPMVTLVIANGLRHGTRAALINIAGAQLGQLSVNAQRVRHPASGGAKLFRQQIARIVG